MYERTPLFREDMCGGSFSRKYQSQWTCCKKEQPLCCGKSWTVLKPADREWPVDPVWVAIMTLFSRDIGYTYCRVHFRYCTHPSVSKSPSLTSFAPFADFMPQLIRVRVWGVLDLMNTSFNIGLKSCLVSIFSRWIRYEGNSSMLSLAKLALT